MTLAARPSATDDQYELVGESEQDAHVRVDAPAGEFRGEVEVLEDEFSAHRHGGGVDGGGVGLGGPGPVDFGHGPGLALFRGRLDFDLSGIDDRFLPRRGEDVVVHGRVRSLP